MVYSSVYYVDRHRQELSVPWREDPAETFAQKEVLWASPIKRSIVSESPPKMTHGSWPTAHEFLNITRPVRVGSFLTTWGLRFYRDNFLLLYVTNHILALSVSLSVSLVTLSCLKGLCLGIYVPANLYFVSTIKFSHSFPVPQVNYDDPVIRSISFYFSLGIKCGVRFYFLDLN